MATVPLNAAAIAQKAISIVAPPLLHSKPTKVAGAALTAGFIVREDPTLGTVIQALADTAPHSANLKGMVWRTVAAGDPITVFKSGLVDGFDLSGLNYGASVYLADNGTLSDTAGTVTVKIGEVESAHAVNLGTAPDKILRLTI